jgi:hypothetical protein
MEAPTMNKSFETAPRVEFPPSFRWWTFGVLILYSAALLVFCTVVTVQNYSASDGLGVRSRSAAVNPPHLAIAPLKLANLANLGTSETAPRTVCYQVSD